VAAELRMVLSYEYRWQSLYEIGDIVQRVAPDLSSYRHGVVGKLGVALLGVVSEKEEDCQLLTDVDSMQHLVDGRVLTRPPLRTPPRVQLICCPQVSAIIEMIHSARMCHLVLMDVFELLAYYRSNDNAVSFWNLTDKSSEMNSNKICGARIHCHVFEFVIHHLRYILKVSCRLAFKLRIKCFIFPKMQSSAFGQGGLLLKVRNVNQISFFELVAACTSTSLIGLPATTISNSVFLYKKTEVGNC